MTQFKTDGVVPHVSAKRRRTSAGSGNMEQAVAKRTPKLNERKVTRKAVAGVKHGEPVQDNQLNTTERLARKLVWAYVATDPVVSQRKIDQRLAAAKLGGICVAANALGFGHTETHVSLTVHEVLRDKPLPSWRAVNNTKRHEWERDCITAVAAALDEIK